MNSTIYILTATIAVWSSLFSTEPAYAGAAVTVTQGGTWAIGTKGASVATPSGNITVKNDASGGNEDITIGVCDSGTTCTNSWLPTTGTPTTNQFTLTTSLTAATKITANSPTTLKTGLANNATQDFTLTLTTPPSGSNQGATTLTVTLTATNWTPPCAGWYYADYCWYPSALGASCTTTCAGHGGCVDHVTTLSQDSAICQHWYPAASTGWAGCTYCCGTGCYINGPDCWSSNPACARYTTKTTPFYTAVNGGTCHGDAYGVVNQCSWVVDESGQTSARQCACAS